MKLFRPQHPEHMYEVPDMEAVQHSVHDYVRLVDVMQMEASNARLRAALDELANSSHQAYDGNALYVSEHNSGYALGVADGHRCAANTARAALAEEPK